MPIEVVQIEGLRELQYRLKKYPEISRPIFAKAINFGLAEINYNARDPQFLFKTPRSERTGYLELSFSEAAAMVRATPEKLEGRIGPTAKYAIYVSQGTNKMQPNPFMVRIMQKSQPKINDLFKEALRQVNEKIAQE